MKFLVYSSTNAQTIDSRLGGVDYSYYFVLESYLPLLRQFGEVDVLADPLDADSGNDETFLAPQYYLSFTPPNKVTSPAALPVIPVFAWEFGTLPDEAVVSDSDNWKHVLQQTGHAITHSQFAVQVVRDALGDAYPVVSIPAPIWDKFAPLRDKRSEQPRHAEMSLGATVIDSGDFEVEDETLRVRNISGFSRVQPVGRCWQGEKIEVDLGEAVKLPLSGQYEGDLQFGAAGGGVLLPTYLSGSVTLDIQLRTVAAETAYLVGLHIGDSSALVRASGNLSHHRIDVDLQHHSTILHFSIAEVVQSLETDLVCVETLTILPNDPVPPEPAEKYDLVGDTAAQWYGVHYIEDWGRWTAQERCGLILPRSIAGNVRLGFTIISSMMDYGDKLVIQLGHQKRDVVLSKLPQSVMLEFSGVECTDHVEFSGLRALSQDPELDERCLGLGLSKLHVEQNPSAQLSRLGRFLDGMVTKILTRRAEPGSDKTALSQLGSYKNVLSRSSSDKTILSRPASDKTVLYTTVFNPIDGRKNWPDIIKAFVFSLRDRPNAVLLVKLTHTELKPFLGDLTSYFLSLAPFKCRIVYVHGYLDRSDYEDLIHATSFIVNASRGEGQCLPLMEFMSSGVPAIAPDNTAMADYITPENAFVVKSTVEPAVWPQDPRLLFRTTRYRINWETLYNAFSESYKLAMTDEKGYARMSNAAIESQRAYCSMEVATSRLSHFLDSISAKEIG